MHVYPKWTWEREAETSNGKPRRVVTEGEDAELGLGCLGCYKRHSHARQTHQKQKHGEQVYSMIPVSAQNCQTKNGGKESVARTSETFFQSREKVVQTKSRSEGSTPP